MPYVINWCTHVAENSALQPILPHPYPFPSRVFVIGLLCTTQTSLYGNLVNRRQSGGLVLQRERKKKAVGGHFHQTWPYSDPCTSCHQHDRGSRAASGWQPQWQKLASWQPPAVTTTGTQDERGLEVGGFASNSKITQRKKENRAWQRWQFFQLF